MVSCGNRGNDDNDPLRARAVVLRFPSLCGRRGFWDADEFPFLCSALS